MQTITAEQTLANSGKNSATLGNVEATLRQRMEIQEKTFSANLAATGTKVEQLSNDLGAVRDSVADVNSKVAKLATAIADISAKLDILITKPEAPKPEGSSKPSTPAGKKAPPGKGAPAKAPPKAKPKSA